jgi:hypothetical protein
MEIPDSLMVSDAISKIEEPNQRIFDRFQRAIGCIGKSSSKVGP